MIKSQDSCRQLDTSSRNIYCKTHSDHFQFKYTFEHNLLEKQISFIFRINLHVLTHNWSS